MLSRRPHPPVRPIDATDSELRDIGQLLRETRQGRGEDVYDIAEYLRIRPAYLFALEQGDLSIMPGRPYAMGFLRTYGDYLEVDGAELVQRVRRAKDTVIAGPELVYRTPAPDNRRPTKALIAASIVGAAFIYGSWYLSYSGFTSLLDRITGLPLAVGEVAVSLFAEDEPEAPPAVQATVQAGAPGAPRPSNAGTGRPTNRDGG
ncbi:MAG TPA: helix-turn-helix domain-containing protein, partial [Geminicoccaceae bacterium]|nr:helix-turn-helix domain-containing protein [Geminicoccaceae bacterium]